MLVSNISVSTLDSDSDSANGLNSIPTAYPHVLARTPHRRTTPEVWKDRAMEQRKIGSLSVSVVGLGCNQLGTKACDDATSLAVIADSLDAGITLFDTSDEYGRDYTDNSDLTGWGHSEELLGQALRAHRDDVVIASKFGPIGSVVGGVDATGHDQIRSRASAEGVRLAVEESLARLGTDRIDLYQLHFPDPRYPIEETLGVLDELVREGKVIEIGCSNFDGTLLRHAADAADELGVGRFVNVQNQLNLFQRKALDDTLPTCVELGVTFVPYYPLASGMLTGKYRRGEAAPAGTRIAEQVGDDVRAKMLSDRAFDRVESLTAYAEARGHTLIELAFGWLLGQPQVASVISGASRPGQPSANAAASGWQLTATEVAEITASMAAL
jgi:aryl-alcohol dehydrogenase-like predicted oxidoreductase